MKKPRGSSPIHTLLGAQQTTKNILRQVRKVEKKGSLGKQWLTAEASRGGGMHSAPLYQWAGNMLLSLVTSIHVPSLDSHAQNHTHRYIQPHKTVHAGAYRKKKKIRYHLCSPETQTLQSGLGKELRKIIGCGVTSCQLTSLREECICIFIELIKCYLRTA